MNLLLDTHVLLWWLAVDKRLRRQAEEAIRDPQNTVFLSMASVWEIAIKKGIGKLDAPSDLEERLRINEFLPLQVTFQHADVVATLPLLHRDPFDRMLVAQAMSESLTIVTRDSRFAQYGVPTLTG